MSLGVRKWIVIVVIAAIFLSGNIMLITNWLIDTGLCDWARFIRKEFLTGTAIAIIVTLLILLENRQTRIRRIGLIRRCPVCDQALLDGGAYCSELLSNVVDEELFEVRLMEGFGV